MTAVLNMIFSVWSSAWQFMRSWKIFGNVSYLSFMLMLFIFGLLIDLLFVRIYREQSIKDEDARFARNKSREEAYKAKKKAEKDAQKKAGGS